MLPTFRPSRTLGQALPENFEFPERGAAQFLPRRRFFEPSGPHDHDLVNEITSQIAYTRIRHENTTSSGFRKFLKKNLLWETSSVSSADSDEFTNPYSVKPLEVKVLNSFMETYIPKTYERLV
jgi:hypothetical protein